MTAKEQILNFLTENKYTSGGYTPTQIGMKLGKEYKNASSWCAAPLKQLMKEGKVNRIKSNLGVKYFVGVK